MSFFSKRLVYTKVQKHRYYTAPLSGKAIEN
ncbi:hypothetical protein SAMN05421639_102364 [Chryseobacterium shigense]|uniref:Uncharacterized protein n=1 Tax=Chryseobacterium shigense TaxID=297244 RepID=A0A1N7I6Q7_9FLAO|nr:hypothetical protein SAMN05421639_102364 [Chryseobacterium shigense]